MAATCLLILIHTFHLPHFVPTKNEHHSTAPIIFFAESFWHEWLTLQSHTIQGVDWQQHKWTATFTIFLFFFSIKKHILKKLNEVPKNLVVDSFLDPVSHFWAQWWPFWNF